MPPTNDVADEQSYCSMDKRGKKKFRCMRGKYFSARSREIFPRGNFFRA
jgi:hypothetical protein